MDGNEPSVLAGARETIERFRPRIMIEFAPSGFGPRDDPGFAKMVRTLDAFGYRFFRIPSRRPLKLDLSDIEATIPFGASVNVLGAMDDEAPRVGLPRRER